MASLFVFNCEYRLGLTKFIFRFSSKFCEKLGGGGRFFFFIFRTALKTEQFVFVFLFFAKMLARKIAPKKVQPFFIFFKQIKNWGGRFNLPAQFSLFAFTWHGLIFKKMSFYTDTGGV